VGADAEHTRETVLTAVSDDRAVLRDVADMRRRLAAAKPMQGPLDPKFGPGRLQDIELLAEAGALIGGALDRDVAAQIAAGASALGLSTSRTETLTTAHRLFWQVQSAARLIGSAAGDPDALGQGARRFLSSVTGAPDIAALSRAMATSADAVDAVMTETLGSIEGDG